MRTAFVALIAAAFGDGAGVLAAVLIFNFT